MAAGLYTLCLLSEVNAHSQVVIHLGQELLFRAGVYVLSPEPNVIYLKVQIIEVMATLVVS